jgi:hypothetical protein
VKTDENIDMSGNILLRGYSPFLYMIPSG